MNDTEIRTGVIRPVECVTEGWELIKTNYWILFAILFVGVIIGSFSIVYSARRDDVRDFLLLFAGDRRQRSFV